MEALNAKEKTIALLKFLGVFLVLIILIVLGVYYDYEMPGKQLKLLKAENESLRNSSRDQKLVLLTLDSLYFQLARYDKEPDQIVLNNTIGKEISRLLDIATADSTMNGKILGRTAQAFQLDFKDKQELQALGKSASALTDKDQMIKDLKSEADKNERTIEDLRLKLKLCSN